MAKSFNSAFREARDSGMKTFEWRGKSYSTKMAGEDLPTRRVPLPPVRDEIPQGRRNDMVERGEDLEDLTPARSDKGMKPLPRLTPGEAMSRDLELLKGMGSKMRGTKPYEAGVKMTDSDVSMKRFLADEGTPEGYAKGGLVKKPKAKPVMKMAKGGMMCSPRKKMAMGMKSGGMVKGCKRSGVK